MAACGETCRVAAGIVNNVATRLEVKKSFCFTAKLRLSCLASNRGQSFDLPSNP